jgi:hypothetical protein
LNLNIKMKKAKILINEDLYTDIWVYGITPKQTILNEIAFSNLDGLITCSMTKNEDTLFLLKAKKGLAQGVLIEFRY